MKVFSKFGLFTALTVMANLALSACEVTPYGADVAPDYCKSLSIRTNIQKLKSLEQANPSKQNFKVAIISDSHVNLDSLARAVERINRRSDIDFVMILGDLTDQGLESQYQFTCKNLSKFEKPFISVIGNHDSLSNGKLLWTQYFGDASKGFDGYNYSFSYLGTKFIAYNDNGFEFQNVPDQSFIQREAAISAGEVRNHTVAASHVQPNSEVHTDPVFRANFLQMLANSKIDMTIHGHRHSFFYDKDAFNNNHYVVAWTKDESWGVMNISPSKIVMENCTGDTCMVVEPN